MPEIEIGKLARQIRVSLALDACLIGALRGARINRLHHVHAFDDFAERRGGWGNFEEQMLHVLPGARFVDLDASHPIFHSFFEINDLDIIPQYYDVGKPIFRGIFENNDPAKRLMVMINFNTDISEFWEWSDTGLKPIDESNEAYKLGVNYIIYGMTH